MSDTKFTQGPWTVQGACIAAIRTSGYSYVHICDVQEVDRSDRPGHLSDFGEISKANANVIAAAPELYDALKLAYDHLLVWHPEVETNNVGEVITKALGKARGER